MLSGKHNITIENGSTFEMDLALTNDDDSNYDLLGYSVDMQIRNSMGNLILDCEQYISIINTNHIAVDIPATATVNIAETAGDYQVEIYTGAKEYSVLRGKVEFVEAIIK